MSEYYIASDMFTGLSMYSIPDTWIAEFKSEGVYFIDVTSVDSVILNEIEVYFGNHLTESTLKKLPNLKWIHLGSAGLDRVLNLRHVLSSEILITNSKDIMTKAVSMHGLACVLSSCRGLFTAKRLFDLGVLNRKSFDNDFLNISDGTDVTVLICGRGSISSQLSDWLTFLGMSVDMVGREELKRSHLDWSRFDYILNILPFDSDFKGFFNRSIFEKMREGSVFISLGRGQAVKEKDLFNFVNSGHLRNAFLDVFEEEPFESSNYSDMGGRVIFTPHVAGMFRDYWPMQLSLFKSNLVRYKQGLQLLNIVNLER